MLQLVGFQIAFQLLYETEEAVHDLFGQGHDLADLFLARQVAVAVGGADTVNDTLDSLQSRANPVRSERAETPVLSQNH